MKGKDFRPAKLEELKEMLGACNFELDWQTGIDHLVARVWHVRQMNLVKPQHVWFFYNRPTNKMHMYIINNSAVGRDQVYTSPDLESSA